MILPLDELYDRDATRVELDRLIGIARAAQRARAALPHDLASAVDILDRAISGIEGGWGGVREPVAA